MKNIIKKNVLLITNIELASTSTGRQKASNDDAPEEIKGNYQHYNSNMKFAG